MSETSTEIFALQNRGIWSGRDGAGAALLSQRFSSFTGRRPQARVHAPTRIVWDAMDLTALLPQADSDDTADPLSLATPARTTSSSEGISQRTIQAVPLIDTPAESALPAWQVRTEWRDRTHEVTDGPSVATSTAPPAVERAMDQAAVSPGRLPPHGVEGIITTTRTATEPAAPVMANVEAPSPPALGPMERRHGGHAVRTKDRVARTHSTIGPPVVSAPPSHPVLRETSLHQTERDVSGVIDVLTLGRAETIRVMGAGQAPLPRATAHDRAPARAEVIERLATLQSPGVRESVVRIDSVQVVVRGSTPSQVAAPRASAPMPSSAAAVSSPSFRNPWQRRHRD
jgi:hypothetical protein